MNIKKPNSEIHSEVSYATIGQKKDEANEGDSLGKVAKNREN